MNDFLIKLVGYLDIPPERQFNFKKNCTRIQYFRKIIFFLNQESEGKASIGFVWFYKIWTPPP